MRAVREMNKIFRNLVDGGEVEVINSGVDELEATVALGSFRL